MRIFRQNRSKANQATDSTSIYPSKPMTRPITCITIAGVLDKICDMTAFLNPTENSYLRFGENKAPGYVSWSSENRSQLVRIPAAVGEYRRAELRSPDPTANPYLAFALIIYAGLHGIKTGLNCRKLQTSTLQGH